MPSGVEADCETGDGEPGRAAGRKNVRKRIERTFASAEDSRMWDKAAREVLRGRLEMCGGGEELLLRTSQEL